MSQEDQYADSEAFDATPVTNPFAVAAAPQSTAALALQKREETEVFAMVMMAKRFPRDPAAAMDLILTDFARQELAEVAQYQYARGGTDITGPSIRSAEAIAQRWGNLDMGWREEGRGQGPGPKGDPVPYSEVFAYCMDLQTTMRKHIRFMVPHWRDTKGGGYKLKDERDIYELCANQAQRRLRACILACLPGDVVKTAMKQATTTLHAKADTSPESQKKLVDAFAAFGVTKEHIEGRIQRRLDAISAGQVVQLKRIYASLRDDMSKPSEWFDMQDAAPEGNGKTTSVDELAAKKRAAEEAVKAAMAAPAADQPHGQVKPTPAPATDLAGTPVAGAATGGPTPPTPEALIEKMKKAKNVDALDTHAAWITPAAYPDEAVRLKLGEHYEARKAELSK